MEEYKIALEAVIDPASLTNLQTQLKNADIKPIPIKLDTKIVDNQIKTLRTQIESLSKIKINLGAGRTRNGSVSISQETAAYKELLSIASQIDKLSLKTGGMKFNGGDIKNAEQELANLRSRYDELYQELSTKSLDKAGFKKFRAQISGVKADLTSLEAELTKTQSQMATGIKTNIANGNLGSQVADVERKFIALGVESKEVTANITTLRTLLSSMDSSDDIESVVADYEVFKQTLATVTNQVKTLKATGETTQLINARTALSSDIDVWLQNNSAAAKTFGAQLQNIKSQIASADKTTLTNLRAQFVDLTKQAKLAGVAGLSMGDQFKRSLRTVSSYFSATMLITRAISVMRNMYNEVLKVDTAMTGLKRVTNLTGEEYEKMYAKMTKSAKEYGATLTDIINSTASWVRLGFDADVAEQLSEVTAVYQHVADLDYDTAVKNLVTTYKGYQDYLLELSNGDEVKAMTYISDIFDKLNNEMPVTAAQVGEGMTKAASVLEMSGATLEEATGMIVGGGSITQDFSAFGNALRVSALRIRSMKGELEELGEEVDDSISSVSKVQTQILNLTHGKVNIFEDDGETFRDIYDIYSDIAAIYDDLSDTERSSLLELLAGKVRANQIQGMLKQWSDVEAATQKAYESEGTAAKENDIYMESMQGRINATKAAWQSLANTILSSDFLKVLISSGQTFFDILNAIVDKTGALPPLLAIIAGYLSASKNIGIITTINKDLTSTITGVSTLSNKMGILGNSFQDIINSYQAYGKSGLKNIFANTSGNVVTSMDIDMLKSFNNELANGVPKTEALQNTMFGASKGAKALAMGADSTGVNLQSLEVVEEGYIATTIGAKVATVALQAALTFGIAMAIQGVITLFQKLKDAIPTAENTANWLEESSQELKTLQDEVDDLNDELNTTKKRIDELLRKDHLTLVEQNELKRLKQANDELEREIALKEHSLAISQGKNEGNFIKAVEAKKNEGHSSLMGSGQLPNVSAFSQMLNGYMEMDEEWMSNYLDSLDEYLDELGEYDYSKLSDDAKAAVDYIKDAQNAYLVKVGDDKLAFTDIFNQERFAEGKAAIEALNDAGKLTASTFEDLYNNNEYVKAMVDNMQEVGLVNDLTAETFAGLSNQITETQKVVGTIAKDEKVAFSDLISNEYTQETIKNFKNDLSDLSQALEDFRNGDLSNSDLLELYEKFPELASRSDDLDAALSDLIDTTQQEVDNQFDEWEDNMPTQDDVDTLNRLRSELKGVGDDSADAVDQLSNLKTALDDLKSTYDDIQDIIEDYNENGYLTLDNLQSIMDLEPEYINLLIDENGQINLNNQAYKDYVASKAKSLLVSELKDLYSSVLSMKVEEAQAYANAIAYDEETRSVKDLLTATTQLYYAKAMAKDSANNTTAYTDAMKQSFSTAANYAAMVDDYINSLSTTQNEFSTTTNETTSALESQKEALEDEKDALEDYKDSLEDAKDALEDYKDGLENAQDSLQELIDTVTDYIKQTKEDEKSALEDQIDALDKQKDALDESKDKYAEIIDAKKEALKLAKEEKEAAEELADKQKSVAKDRLALEVAGLDDSSAGRKAYKQAKDNLADSQKDLSDYLADQSYEKQVAELEDLQEKFEESIEKRKAAIDDQVAYINSKIDEIDEYLDNSRKIYEDACKMIDEDTGELYDNLWNYTYQYTTKTHAEFDKMWSDAQAAIREYQGDNETLMSVMENLQQKIYDTDDEIADLNTQIDECSDQIDILDTAISNTSDAINSTSGAIDNVSSSIGGLASNISAYKAALDALAQTNDDSGIPSNAKWTFEYADNNGNIRTAWSTSSNFETAVRDIQGVIERETGYYRPDVFGGIKKHFASGTRHTPSTFISQENGLEAIFAKNPKGKGTYTLTTPDSQVFDHQRTDELYNFSGDPEVYISKLAEKGLSILSSEELSNLGWGNSFAILDFMQSIFNGSDLIKSLTSAGNSEVYNNDNSANNNNYTVNMPIQIQGNADQSVIQALNRYKGAFKKEMISELTRIGEKFRR